MAIAHTFRPISEEAFWNLVDIRDGCWEWLGDHSPNGYPYTVREKQGENKGKRRGAHRVAYEYLKGSIPEGFDLDHLCRNRGCVNPDHLEPVTRRENLLRGKTIPAHNIKKTHCPRGHSYEGVNLRIERTVSGVGRACRECKRRRNREAKRRQARARNE